MDLSLVRLCPADDTYLTAEPPRFVTGLFAVHRRHKRRGNARLGPDEIPIDRYSARYNFFFYFLVVNLRARSYAVPIIIIARAKIRRPIPPARLGVRVRFDHNIMLYSVAVGCITRMAFWFFFFVNTIILQRVAGIFREIKFKRDF